MSPATHSESITFTGLALEDRHVVTSVDRKRVESLGLQEWDLDERASRHDDPLL